MRNLFVTLMASLASCSAAFAFWPEAADSNIELGVGYRRDKLEWNTRSCCEVPIDGVGFPINLGSKLEWKNLNIWQIEARGKYVTCDNIYLRGYIDYGWITSGRVSDKDDFSCCSNDCNDCDNGFCGFDDCDDCCFSRQSCKTKKGHVYDASLGIGYQFRMCDDSFAITPIVGYSWHGQHLNMSNGKDSCCDTCDDDCCSDSFSGLKSRYNTRWNGPWIGFDLDYRLACDWSIFGGYEFHWAKYHAKGKWNLRNDFCDLPDGFTHSSNRAWGNIVNLGVRWDFCDCWTASLTGQWMGWEAKNGTDKHRCFDVSACDCDISVDVNVKQKLKKVTWQSGSIMLDVGMVF